MSNQKFNLAFVNPEAVPPNLEEHRDDILGMLRQLAAGSVVADADVPAGARSFLQLSAAETEATVSIFGDRGSGKTTLLQFVCSRLFQDGSDLVLPILRPERFATHDTLSGWVLATLHKVLELDHPDVLGVDCEVGGISMTIDEWIRRIRRDEAIIGRGYGEGLPRQNLTTAEFGRDASRMSSAGASFGRNWRALVDKLLTALFPVDVRERPPLFIIPLDDADLRPELLPSLFLEMRRLTAHPAIAVLFCASEAATKQAVLSHHLLGGDHEHQTTALLDRGFIARTAVLGAVHKHFQKALPSHLRVSLKHLEPEERLLFTPIGDSDSLLDLLRQVPYDGPYLESLADLFVLKGLNQEADRAAIDPSPYATCLPSMPRDLEYLYRKLKRLMSKAIEEKPEQVSRALQAVIDDSLSFSSTQVPSHLAPPVRWLHRADKVGIELDFRGMEWGETISTGFSRLADVEGAMVRYRYRRVHRFFANATPPAGEEDREVGAMLLPHPFVYGLFLAYQIASETSFVVHEGEYGQLDTPGGSAWSRHPAVRVDGQATDDLFWTVPDWPTHYDYFLYVQGWNRLIDVASAGSAGEDPQRRHLDWFLLAHLEMIGTIHKSRTLPARYWQATPERLSDLLTDDDRWSDYQTELEEQLSALFSELYLASTTTAVEEAVPGAPGLLDRERAFGAWFRSSLVWAADPLASTKRRAEWILSTRARIIEGSGDDLQDVNKTAARVLIRRLRDSISEDWIGWTLRLLDLLDSELASSLLEEHEAARIRTDEDFQRIVSRLAEMGYPEDLILRMRTQGITQDTVAAARKAGVPPDYIELLLRRFLRREPDLDREQGIIETIDEPGADKP